MSCPALTDIIRADDLVSPGMGIHTLDRLWMISVWARDLTEEYCWLQVNRNEKRESQSGSL